jgi:hypothetical protein
MYFILSDFVFGFVFGVGASMVLMFACDRYDDWRDAKEKAERQKIIADRAEKLMEMKKRQLAKEDEKKEDDSLTHDERMSLIREFSDPDRKEI